MGPIDRVRAKAWALAELGLGYYAEHAQIKAAWHRIARECHPDVDRSQLDRFTRAKFARDFLIGEEGCIAPPEDSGDTRSVAPRRIRQRVGPFGRRVSG